MTEPRVVAGPLAPIAPVPTQIAYDLPGASEVVSVSTDHLRREIRAGRLRARMVGRKYRIAHRDLQDWFDALPEA